MAERPQAITFKGDPLTLVGDPVQVGDQAPDFQAMDINLNLVTLAACKGKPCIIASVPSLDTSVCSMETKRFNDELEKLGDVTMATISMDLPFAQKRWADENHAHRITFLSDHRDASFGMAWGVLIKELRLLARGVFVVDKQGKVAHAQLVQEVTDEPDYQAVLDSVQALV
jgi:thiol peroxidase